MLKRKSAEKERSQQVTIRIRCQDAVKSVKEEVVVCIESDKEKKINKLVVRKELQRKLAVKERCQKFTAAYILTVNIASGALK